MLSYAWRFNYAHAGAFLRVHQAVSGGKPPKGNGVKIAC